METQYEPDLYDYGEKIGFKPGQELDDWFEAEHEIRKQRRYWLR